MYLRKYTSIIYIKCIQPIKKAIICIKAGSKNVKKKEKIEHLQGEILWLSLREMDNLDTLPF